MSRTRFVMTVIVIVVSLYDLCVVTFSGNIDASVSKWFQSFATYPAIVFGLGYVFGHFFGWMAPTMPQGKREQLNRIADEMASHSQLISFQKLEEWAKRIWEIAGK